MVKINTPKTKTVKQKFPIKASTFCPRFSARKLLDLDSDLRPNIFPAENLTPLKSQAKPSHATEKPVIKLQPKLTLKGAKIQGKRLQLEGFVFIIIMILSDYWFFYYYQLLELVSLRNWAQFQQGHMQKLKATWKKHEDSEGFTSKTQLTRSETTSIASTQMMQYLTKNNKVITRKKK